MTVTVLNALFRPVLEAKLPGWVEPRWFASHDELMALAPEAEIGWFDRPPFDKGEWVAAIEAATRLKWLNSIFTGVDGLPLDTLKARGVVMTNGAGLGAVAISEWAVTGILALAKSWREVVHAQDRHEWLHDAPGKVELPGTKALIIGMGAIGTRIARLLEAFEVEVTGVRRTPGAGELGPHDWQARLGEFDWVVLAAPATTETEAMIGAAELAAMKPGAALVNIARGSLIDQDALIAALKSGHPAAALLDVTSPEPLPADHPLWTTPGAHVTMHLSGRAQTSALRRSAERFLANLARWKQGEALAPIVDYDAGY